MPHRIIRSKALDNFCTDLYEQSTQEQKMRLSPAELRAIKTPQRFASKKVLDEKMIVSTKLSKRAYIILIDEDSEITHVEFSEIFRRTFIDDEKNKKAFDLMDGKGMLIIGNETVARFIQKAELFMNSDLYEVAKTIKRMKNKKASVSTVIGDKESDIKELFMHTILRVFFAVSKMDDYLKMMAMNEKEFAILCALYLTARPMSESNLREYIGKVLWKVGDLRSNLKHLAMKNYILKVERESTHNNRTAALWMNSPTAHNSIENFLNKVLQETVSNVYE